MKEVLTLSILTGTYLCAAETNPKTPRSGDSLTVMWRRNLESGARE